MQDIKIFLKKKKLKDEKMLEKDIGILLKKREDKRHQYYVEQENKLPGYRRNYYSVHKKQLKDPRTITLVSRIII